ncbi:MAG: hypothetical protein ACTIDG_18300, partial [Cellulosimicrobium funkei]|uniref:hypothetical protein n=1 Tax=Cellulosimicrobium funkei TaxID=264251 RepID=UPI003F8E51DD
MRGLVGRSRPRRSLVDVGARGWWGARGRPSGWGLVGPGPGRYVWGGVAAVVELLVGLELLVDGEL